jgi:hypothetical protein
MSLVKCPKCDHLLREKDEVVNHCLLVYGFNPFHILGTWQFGSELSLELKRFSCDGTYQVFFRSPFRMIETGTWSIEDGYLNYQSNGILLKDKIKVLSPILLRTCFTDNNGNKIVTTYLKV